MVILVLLTDVNMKDFIVALTLFIAVCLVRQTLVFSRLTPILLHFIFTIFGDNWILSSDTGKKDNDGFQGNFFFQKHNKLLTLT